MATIAKIRTSHGAIQPPAAAAHCATISGVFTSNVGNGRTSPMPSAMSTAKATTGTTCTTRRSRTRRPAGHSITHAEAAPATTMLRKSQS